MNSDFLQLVGGDFIVSKVTDYVNQQLDSIYKKELI